MVEKVLDTLVVILVDLSLVVYCVVSAGSDGSNEE